MESEVGRGSAFHFTGRFRIRKTATTADAVSQLSEQLRPFKNAGEKSNRILLAEDNLINQSMAIAMLKRGGTASYWRTMVKRPLL